MTPVGPHPAPCSKLRFSVLPAHPTEPHPPWRPYKRGSCAPPSRSPVQAATCGVLDRGVVLPHPRESPNAGGCSGRTRYGKGSPVERGRSRPAVTTQAVATPSAHGNRQPRHRPFTPILYSSTASYNMYVLIIILHAGIYRTWRDAVAVGEVRIGCNETC